MGITIGLLGALVLAGPPICGGEGEICLEGDRFEVRVSFDGSGTRFGPPPPLAGIATPTRYTDDTATFAFGDAGRLDGLVKVFDACQFVGRYWVFGAFPTDADVTLTVLDTQTAESQSYRSPSGAPGTVILDTRAFDSCPPARSGLAGPVIDRPSGGSGACAGSATVACVNEERFELSVSDVQFGDEAPVSGMIGVENDDAAAFWFFQAEDLVLIANVFDGDAGDFRFQAAGTTNVTYGVTVRDTATGRVNRYVNPLGQSLVFLDGVPVEPAPSAGSRAVAGATLEVVVEAFNPNTIEVEFSFDVEGPPALADLAWRCIDGLGVFCPGGEGRGLADTIRVGGRRTARIALEAAVPLEFLGTSLAFEATTVVGPDALRQADQESTAAFEVTVVPDGLFASSFEADEAPPPRSAR